LLLDVTPLTLGLETLGGVMTPLIERNTTIPVKKSEVFSTADDNQTAVDIHVLQGERPMAADNMTLGRFRLDGLPPAPRGLPQVEVTFDIDANGIINVAARDKATGKEQKVTITASTNLDKKDIERMVEQANVNKADDMRRKELVEARNFADSATYQAEKTVRDLGEKVSSQDKDRIEGLVKTLKETAEGENTVEIKRQIDELQQAMSAIGTQAYQQSGSPEGGEPGSQQSPDGDKGDVVEGEFKSV